MSDTWLNGIQFSAKWHYIMDSYWIFFAATYFINFIPSNLFLVFQASQVMHEQITEAPNKYTFLKSLLNPIASYVMHGQNEINCARETMLCDPAMGVQIKCL